jgi:hypothetical protein
MAVKLNPNGSAKARDVSQADVAMLSQTVKVVSSTNADMNPKQKQPAPKTSDLCSHLKLKCSK